MKNSVATSRFTLSLSVLFFAVSALTGCAGSVRTSPDGSSDNQYAGGYISLNRVAPQVASPATLLGFMPDASEDQNTSWLKVELSQNKMLLMKGNKVVEETSIEGTLPLHAGVYSLQHKQRSPLWYAGDDYFSLRGLSVPSIGDKSRYRRGALGDFALFVDSDASIHSAPMWTAEVGGLRIDDEKMKKIYYSLDVGAKVQVTE